MQTILDIAKRWTGTECILDGRKAVIVNPNIGFAIVASYDGKRRAEYSWQTVDNVMQSTEQFRM